MSAYALPGSFYYGTETNNAQSNGTSHKPAAPSQRGRRRSKYDRIPVRTTPDQNPEGTKDKGTTPKGLFPKTIERNASPSLDGKNNKVAVLEEDPFEGICGNTGPNPTALDDALQFLISITLDGRRYTATRTLPRFVALRNELIKEVRIKARSNRRRTTQAASSNKGGAGMQLGATIVDIFYKQRYRELSVERDQSSTTSHTDESTLEDEDGDIAQYDEINEDDIIPALPMLENEPSGNDVNDPKSESSPTVPNGASQLQAKTQNLRPAMERWLCQVAQIVPPNTSPSLMRFLWEPLNKGVPQSIGVPKSSTRHRQAKLRRVCTLDSINENETCGTDGDVVEEESDEGEFFLLNEDSAGSSSSLFL